MDELVELFTGGFSLLPVSLDIVLEALEFVERGALVERRPFLLTFVHDAGFGFSCAMLRKSTMAKKPAQEILIIDGREVTISNPSKVLFPQAEVTKLDLVRYYLAVAEGALRGSGGRPNVLVRYPNGLDGEFFYQKRAPDSRPDWIEVVELKFPSGRTAEEVVPRNAAALA